MKLYYILDYNIVCIIRKINTLKPFDSLFYSKHQQINLKYCSYDFLQNKIFRRHYST
jgi:hypothetical protein